MHDIEKIERVQKRAVASISGLRHNLSYEEKCREVDLDPLVKRRAKQDVLQAFKIIRGIDKVDSSTVFIRRGGEGGTRTRAGAAQNLAVPAARLEIRKNSYFVRTSDMWNKLPAQAKEAKSVREFKTAINTLYNADEW